MPQTGLMQQRKVLLLTAAILLTGCATAPGFSAPPAEVCRLLPMQAYTRSFNERLADEIASATRDAVWPYAVRDYVKLRDAVRACAH